MIEKRENIEQLTFIIQARLGSTRLPEKMILPFHNGCSVFEIIIDKLLQNFPQSNVVIATSTKQENDLLEIEALSKGCSVFRGEENDVLSRFVAAAKHFNAHKIIRICADNPFLDIQELKRLMEYSNTSNADYVSFKVNGLPSIKSHFGFWAEYVKLEALERICYSTKELIYREHVTNYIYENPSDFHIEFIVPNANIIDQKDIRMTLDTPKDFELLSEIYSNLFAQFESNFGIDEILHFLHHNSYYRDAMILEINKNLK